MRFDAEATDYAEVTFTIELADMNDTAMNGTSQEYIIVYSSVGTPVSPLDGVVVGTVTAPAAGTDLVVTANVTPGDWAYFSLFGQYELTDVLVPSTGALATVRLGGVPDPGLAALATPQWVLLASQAVLLPFDHGYAARLWLKIPEWYRRREIEQVGPGGVLRKLIDVLGREVDIQRTWASTLGDVWDIERVPSALLPHLGAMLGAPNEIAAGEKRYRSYLGNLMHFRKTKGTLPSIEGAVEAITGYRTLAYVGKNMLLTVDDSDLRTGIGRWASLDTLPLTHITPTGLAGEPVGKNYASLLNNTAGTVTGKIRYSGAGVSALSVIPVQVGHAYRFSFFAGGTDAAVTSFVRMIFYGQGATTSSFISQVDGAVTPLNDVVGGGAFVNVSSGWVVAPTNAKFALVEIHSSLPAGVAVRAYDFMFVDQAWQYEGMPGEYLVSGPTLAHEPARAIHVNVYPSRTNYAVNSDFSQNYTNGWSTTSPAAAGLYWYIGGEALATRSFSSQSGGPAAGFVIDIVNHWATMTSNDPTDPRVSRAYSYPFPVTSELAYSAAIEIQSTAALNTSVTLRFHWYAGDSLTELPNSTHSSPTTYLTTEWARVTVTNGVPPLNAAWGRLEIETTKVGGGHIERIRKILIEDRATPGEYFDGRSEDGLPGDYGFVGDLDASFSVYHQNYDSMLNADDTSRAYTIALEYTPMGRDVVLHTAANGLL